MSDENLKVLQRVFEAWNAGDLDGVTELFSPQAEFVPLRSLLEGLPYRGPDGIRQFARDAAEEWEFLRVTPDEFRDLGDRVLMLGHFEGRGRASGMDVRFPVGWVAEVYEGKITRMRSYSDPHEALEAVGLRE